METDMIFKYYKQNDINRNCFDQFPIVSRIIPIDYNGEELLKGDYLQYEKYVIKCVDSDTLTNVKEYLVQVLDGGYFLKNLLTTNSLNEAIKYIKNMKETLEFSENEIPKIIEELMPLITSRNIDDVYPILYRLTEIVFKQQIEIDCLNEKQIVNHDNENKQLLQYIKYLQGKCDFLHWHYNSYERWCEVNNLKK